MKLKEVFYNITAIKILLYQGIVAPSSLTLVGIEQWFVKYNRDPLVIVVIVIVINFVC